MKPIVLRKIITPFLRTMAIALFLVPLFIFEPSSLPSNLYWAVLIVRGFLIVALSWLFISSTHRLFKNPAYKMLGFLTLFVFGVYVYAHDLQNKYGDCIHKNHAVYSKSEDGGYNAPYLAVINNALSVFFPSRDAYDRNLSINYQLLLLFANLYFLMMVFSIWGRRMINRSRLFLIPPYFRNMIWGYNKGGELLAKDILEKTIWQQALFVLPKEIRKNAENDHYIFEEIDAMQAVALYHEIQTQTKIRKARRHFFLSEDQPLNVEMALKAIDLLKASKSKRKTHLYVRTETEHIDRFFTEKLTTANRQGCRIEIHILNQSDLTARHFIRTNPMLDCPGIAINHPPYVSGEFNLLVLGFGLTGYEMLKKCVCDGQFKGSAFSATIIDSAYEEELGRYTAFLKEAIEQYHITFNPQQVSNVTSPLFFSWVEKNIAHYNRIVITLGNDDLNIETALAVSRLLQGKGILNTGQIIFAHVYDNSRFNCYNTAGSPITLFGNLTDIYTREVLINEQMDSVAKAMNATYSGITDANKIEAAWLWDKETNKPVSVFAQESSRAAACGARNTLQLLGYKFVNKASEGIPLTNEEYATAIEKCIETLSDNEHRRWCAFHFMNGIRLWKKADINYDKLVETDMKANQIDRYNRHAALIGYNELPGLDVLINVEIEKWNRQQNKEEDIKKKVNNQQHDRNFVANIPVYMKLANRKIVKL